MKTTPEWEVKATQRAAASDAYRANATPETYRALCEANDVSHKVGCSCADCAFWCDGNL